MITGSKDEQKDDQICSQLERRSSKYEGPDDERKPFDEVTLCPVNAELCPVDPVCGNSNGQILKLVSNYTTELKHISLLQPEELGSTEPYFNLLQNYCTWNNSHVRFSLIRSKAIDESLTFICFHLFFVCVVEPQTVINPKNSFWCLHARTFGIWHNRTEIKWYYKRSMWFYFYAFKIVH